MILGETLKEVIMSQRETLNKLKVGTSREKKTEIKIRDLVENMPE